MNILRFRYFAEVAQKQSFSDAADALFTTQSTVSKHIIALEQELNTQLFDRSKRKITLTDQGKIVLEYAMEIIQSYDNLLCSIAEFEQLQGSNLAIASIPVMAQYNITTLVANFRAIHPNINMTVDEQEGQDILPALESRQFEMAFMRGDVLDSNTYERIDLYKDRFIAIIPQNHPLSHCKSIPLLKLKSENFLLLNKRTLLYESCIVACEKSGFTPTVKYTGTRMENIVELVAKGMGISLMMEKAAAYVKTDGVCHIPLDEEIHSTVSLVRSSKKKLTQTGLMFWNFVKNSKDF